MGSYSVSCNLSNLSLYDNEIGILLLKKRKDVDVYINNYICSNAGPEVFYSPISPLIYGNYDTEGNIQNIEINNSFTWTCEKLNIPNTEKAFRSYFDNLPQDDVYVTFFNKNIANQAIAFQREKDSLFNYYKQSWVVEKFPEFFTLKEETEDQYKGKKSVYSIQGSKKTLTVSEGSVSSSKGKNFFNTFDLLKFIGKETISSKILNTAVGTDIDYEYNKEMNKKDDLLEVLKKSAAISKDKELQKMVDILSKNSDRSKFGALGRKEAIEKEACDVFHLSRFMFLCNKYYYPVFAGTQINDFKNLDFLNSISRKEIDLELQRNKNE
jgi:hypothetical protein